MCALNESPINQYQREAAKTAVYPASYAVLYPAIGLANEAGELLGEIKKILRDDGGKLSDERREKIKSEAGDVCWYLAVLLNDCGLKLDAVLAYNLEKLQGRAQRGTLQGSGENR